MVVDMDPSQLVSMELEQIRAAMQLLAGAVERLAATIEYQQKPAEPPAFPGDLLAFPKPPAPPRKPMGFVDDDVPLDEDLRFRVMSFVDHEPQL